MKATYTIQQANDVVIFKAPALSFKKCNQITRIHNSHKTWQGFKMIAISFSIDGLISVHIARPF